MSWLQRGWDGLDEEDEVQGGQKKEFGPRRFWMPEGVTKRVMFLDANPVRVWEHNLYSLTKNMDREICLKKNGIDKRGCPLCDLKAETDRGSWASHVGYLSVIDMGDVSYNRGQDRHTGATLQGYEKDGTTYQFGRKLYGAKKGGRGKEGVLQKLLRKAHQFCPPDQGGLTYTVWDLHRSGKLVESVGDELEFVAAIDADDVQSYLLDLGANPEYLELEPLDYEEIFTPSSYEKLQRLAGTADAGKVAGEGARSDESVPF